MVRFRFGWKCNFLSFVQLFYFTMTSKLTKSDSRSPVRSVRHAKKKARLNENCTAQVTACEEIFVVDKSGNNKKRKRKLTSNVNEDDVGGSSSKKKELELSVTVGIGNSDVCSALFDNLQEFVKNECARGLFGLEKGGMLNHLHFQMVILIYATSIKAVGMLIKQYLCWDVSKPQGAVVMCRPLRQVRMHTFTGMLGYCMKDLHKPHFRWFAKNVEASEIAEGRAIHAQYGQGELKHRVAITPINLFDRAFVYLENFITDRAGTTLPNTLWRMLSTGRYYPAASWVVPKSGLGMELSRAMAIWRCMNDPSSISLEDIRSIFFRDGDMSRYYEAAALPPRPIMRQNLESSSSSEDAIGSQRRPIPISSDDISTQLRCNEVMSSGPSTVLAAEYIPLNLRVPWCGQVSPEPNFTHEPSRTCESPPTESVPQGPPSTDDVEIL